ncbi:alpha-N-acetylglucosaminidase TIM-barrel domain-containing protein [Breznakia pachnodae]|uniref:F5/8 type C domain-containing protein n=1 Tax=Breznakia pachnodae TaxID=265178 RepID=A0ABU0E5Z2_9FIRM|nr:alpha-N-acetylglucosaminidase TIM-barrel domain-containing protein [Breznakia pachnodae]MDQ0362305.1 hypothetical protein [Breznakia pachnodae]
MDKKFRIGKIIMSFLLLSSVFTFSNDESLSVYADENEPIEYVVKEDAFVRKSKATTIYNFENITKAHGAQYEGLGYRVINSKHYGSDEIIGLMKFDLPTKEEIEANNLDKFEFEFNLFKNANYNASDQDYTFRYTTDTSWSEESITWNTKPESISRDNTNELFTFHIDKGYEYENKTPEEKQIVRDITPKVEELVAAGETEITVFVTAKTSADTSILIHCKETSLEGKQPKIIASSEGINLASLKTLVDEVSTAVETEYTEESYATFKSNLDLANSLIDGNSDDITAIRNAYRSLRAAYQSLEKLTDPNDADNIAYKKPARTNLSKSLVERVNDGDASTTWSGVFFPAYVDIDLMDTYDLTKLQLYTPIGKKTYYTVYGSNDGNTYDRLYQRREALAGTAEGDTITFDTPESYRIIRVYMEYTEGDSKAYLSEIKAYGTKTNTNTDTLRDGSLEEILGVQAYNDTSYAAPISNDETINNVYGIIDRTIGAEYRDWFTFEIADTGSENDYYELSDQGGKIHIKGNEGLSLTTGLNYYFKNYVNVHISEQTMQTKMPDAIVPIGTTVRKETPYQVRYAFNYCTLSYTFAFFGEEEWQRENDWLALNGVNVVLDLAGQEATWIIFLMNYGYSYDDAKDWLTGPSYYAWQFMDNMESFGGPVPDGYVKDRMELARSSQRWKNSLGMQTVLQGYAGMVPTNFNEYQPDVQVIKQGDWNGFARPDMIATDSAEYDEYAEQFYKAQEYVYGATSDYYAVDPFHEGGKRPSNLTDDIISKEVLESLLKYDDKAVWVVQGWQSNPTNALLNGMGEYREDHVLIVDLIKYPIKSWTKYNTTKYGSTTLDSKEFNGTSWAWCLLANFGGNPSMNGQMDVMVEDILNAQKTSNHMQGIGIISEATYDNPVMYDLIFDLAWADEDFSLDKWLDKYIERRYGGTSENAKLAWKTMRTSNYNHGVRYTNEVFGTKNKTPQAYGTQDIPYGADKLETALKLLAEDYDKFKDSESYRYDMTEIMRQVASNYAVLSYNDVLKAKNAGSLEDFKVAKEDFLATLDIVNEIQATQKEQLGGEWIGKATDLAANYDDFSKDTFEMNAKTLITTWGSRAGHSKLKDYGWRNYEGIFTDVYKYNWSVYLDKIEKNLTDGTPVSEISVGGYFDIYWQWVMGEQTYTRDPKDSPEEVKAVVDKVIANCSLTEGLDPNAGNIALEKPIDAIGKVTGKAYQTNDGDVDTVLSAAATTKDGKVSKPEVIVNLVAEFQLSKINIAFDNTDDTYYLYEVYGSADGENWNKIAEKTTNELHEDTGDVITLSNVSARYIKVVGIKDSKHLDDESKTEIRIKEIRAYGERMLPELSQLSSLVETIKGLVLDPNSSNLLEKLIKMLEEASDAVENEAAPDEVNNIYWSVYDYLTTLDLTGRTNVALTKTITAHNDPSGNSKNLIDGESSTAWNSGRLSPTGEAYQHDPITPGWALIDLKDNYDIDEIKLEFDNSTTWYQYEIYGGLTEKDMVLLGEKKTENLPNKKEDTYYVENTTVRYIKIATTNIKVGGDGKRMTYGVRELQVFGTLHVDVNKDDLQTLVDDVAALKEADYTPNSWATLKAPLTTANSVLSDDDATQADVDDALATLQGVVDKLAKRANVTDLNTLIDEVIALKEEQYTPNSWKTLKEPLAKAKEVAADKNASQEDVNTALTSLQGVVDKLAKRADITSLNDLIKTVDDLDEKEFTPNSWKALKEPLADAKALVGDVNATQGEVDTALATLQQVKDQLVKKADVSALNAVITDAEAKVEAAYTKDSWDVFAKELANAKQISSNANATQTEVDSAVAALTNAMNALNRIQGEATDSKALEQLISEVENLKEADYTASSWKQLQEVLIRAKEVLSDENATQPEIDTQLAELKKAKDNLKKSASSVKPTEDNKGEKIEDKKSVDSGDYHNLEMLCAMALLSLIVIGQQLRKRSKKS